MERLESKNKNLENNVGFYRKLVKLLEDWSNIGGKKQNMFVGPILIKNQYWAHMN